RGRLPQGHGAAAARRVREAPAQRTGQAGGLAKGAVGRSAHPLPAPGAAHTLGSAPLAIGRVADVSGSPHPPAVAPSLKNKKKNFFFAARAGGRLARSLQKLREWPGGGCGNCWNSSLHCFFRTAVAPARRSAMAHFASPV